MDDCSNERADVSRPVLLVSLPQLSTGIAMKVSKITVVVALCLSTLLRAEPPVTGLVELSAEVSGLQPRHWPVILNVKLTNAGEEPLSYWTPGSTWPLASSLRVSVRYDVDEAWQDVPATNGPDGSSSRWNNTLASGESITTPLAVPIDPSREYPAIRIGTRLWRSKAPIEVQIRPNDNTSAIDARRAEVISAVIAGDDLFLRDVARVYEDDIVTDAMLKLVTLDSPLIVSRAAEILGFRKSLSAETGNQLAPLVAQWAPRRGQRECDLAAIYLTKAALKTQSPAARRVVLELLDATTDAQVIAMLMDELRLSPGDANWLYELRGHFDRATPRTMGDERAKQTAKVASDWLESRIKQLEEAQNDQ